MDGTFGNTIPYDLGHLHTWVAAQPGGFSAEVINTVCRTVLKIGGESALRHFLTSYPQIDITVDSTQPLHLGGKDLVLRFVFDGKPVEHRVNL